MSPTDIMAEINRRHREVEEHQARIADYQAMIWQHRSSLEHASRSIFKLKAAYNASTLIHSKLPTELLIEIFCHIDPSRRADIRIVHVCRLWRSIIHQIPDFWVGIVRAPNLLGRGYSISITLINLTAPRHYHLNLEGSDLRLLTQWGALDSKAVRLSSLSIVLPQNCHPYLGWLNRLTLPCLKTLRFLHRHSQHPDSGLLHERPHAAPRSKFPQLRHIITMGVLFTSGVPVDTITHLTVTGGVRSAASFLQMLARCVRLEELSMTRCTTPLTPGAQMGPALLPNLRAWTLVGGSDIVSLIFWLARIIPGHPAAELLIFSTAPSIAGLLPTIFSLSTLSPGIDVMRLSFDPVPSTNVGSFTLALAQDRSRRLRLSVRDVVWGSSRGPFGPSSLLHDFFSLLPTALSHHATVVQCDFAGVSIVKHDWVAMLEAFPNVSHLTVTTTSSRKFFRVLRKLPVCGWLACLHVKSTDGSGAHEQIVSAIESLASRGARLQLLVLDRPNPLSKARCARLGALEVETFCCPINEAMQQTNRVGAWRLVEMMDSDVRVKY
ncbi:hypothetical protein C8Q76DRAFT_803869 [Earliella scabrosa]|nr:hypothetical protein C8Q76DRAFT_803869 [Earliella scabrosa]